MVFNGAWDRRRRSVQVLAFFSTVASVGNGSVRAAILHDDLGRLNVRKKESVTSNAFRPIGQPYLHLAHADFLSVVIV